MPAADHIYLALDNDTVVKVRTSDRGIEWTHPSPTEFVNHVAVDADGNVYYSTEEGRLVKLNSAGSTQWSVEVEAEDFAVISAAVDEDGDVYCGVFQQGTFNWAVTRRSGSNGSQVWRTTVSAAPRWIAPGTNGRVHAGLGNADLVTMNIVTGGIVHTFTGFSLSVDAVEESLAGDVYAGGGSLVKKIDDDNVEVWSYGEPIGTVGGVCIDCAGNTYATDKIGSSPFTTSVHKIDANGDGVWDEAIGPGGPGLLARICMDPVGNIFATRGTDVVVALDNDGGELWTFAAADDILAIACDPGVFGCGHWAAGWALGGATPTRRNVIIMPVEF
jgi:hypothetical protein